VCKDIYIYIYIYIYIFIHTYRYYISPKGLKGVFQGTYPNPYTMALFRGAYPTPYNHIL